jgi:hypothetical protein
MSGREVTIVEERTWPPTEEMLAEFASENQELLEALEIFGIASAEYERALSALQPASIRSGSSTQEV